MSVEKFQTIASGIRSEGMSEPEIAKETVGDYVYFKLTAQMTENVFPGKITWYFHMYDGYGFIFGIADFYNAVAGEDAEVEFSAEKALQEVLKTAVFNAEQTGTNAAAPIVLCAVGVVVIAAIVCGVIVMKKKKAAAAADVPDIRTNEEPAPQNDTAPAPDTDGAADADDTAAKAEPADTPENDTTEQD